MISQIVLAATPALKTKRKQKKSKRLIEKEPKKISIPVSEDQLKTFQKDNSGNPTTSPKAALSLLNQLELNEDTEQPQTTDTTQLNDTYYKQQSGYKLTSDEAAEMVNVMVNSGPIDRYFTPKEAEEVLNKIRNKRSQLRFSPQQIQRQSTFHLQPHEV